MTNEEVLKIVGGSASEVLDWCRAHPDWWLDKSREKEKVLQTIKGALKIASGEELDYTSRKQDRLDWRYSAMLLYKHLTSANDGEVARAFRKNRTTIVTMLPDYECRLLCDERLKEKFQKLTEEYQKLWVKV